MRQVRAVATYMNAKRAEADKRNYVRDVQDALRVRARPSAPPPPSPPFPPTRFLNANPVGRGLGAGSAREHALPRHADADVRPRGRRRSRRLQRHTQRKVRPEGRRRRNGAWARKLQKRADLPFLS